MKGLIAFLRARLGIPSRRASGGAIAPRRFNVDSAPAVLSPGRRITDPDDAEALGLAADARRLRRGL